MIHIITTGGTIEGLDYDKEENKPQCVNSSIEKLFEAMNVNFEYLVVHAFCKDSRFISLQDIEILKKKIMCSNAEKILITHGTFTMVETAKYLGKLNIKKTVIIVGAFVLGTTKTTDAPFNLGYAICALQALNNGVYIAMNGNIFPWNNVVKNAKANRFEFIITGNQDFFQCLIHQYIGLHFSIS